MKIYDNIENLPLYNYQKIIETGDYKYLLIEETIITEKLYKKLCEVWQNINIQIIEYNGISKDLQFIMKTEREIAQLEIQLFLTGDKSIVNLIELKQIELRNLQPKVKQSIDEVIIMIENKFKMFIDIHKTTVKKYYSYINYLQKHEGQNKKEY